MTVDVVDECRFVSVRHRNILFAKHNAIALNKLDFARLHNERAMHTKEPLFRQPVLYVLNTHQRHHCSVVIKINSHVVFHAFNEKYF